MRHYCITFFNYEIIFGLHFRYRISNGHIRRQSPQSFRKQFPGFTRTRKHLPNHADAKRRCANATTSGPADSATRRLNRTVPVFTDNRTKDDESVSGKNAWVNFIHMLTYFTRKNALALNFLFTFEQNIKAIMTLGYKPGNLHYASRKYCLCISLKVQGQIRTQT